MIQWEGSSGRIIRSLHVPDASVRSVAFSRSGKLLALSFSDGTIRVVATDTFREIMSESLEEGAVTALSFSADDRVLVAGTSGGEVGICKLAEDRRFVFAKGHPEAVLAVAGHWSKHRELAISGSDDGTLVSWDIRDWPDARYFPHVHKKVTALIPSEDFRSLVSIGGANEGWDEFNLWDSQLPLVLSGYDFHQGRIVRLAASPDALTIWSVRKRPSGLDSRLVDLRVGKELKRFAPIFQMEARPLSSDEISPELLGEWYASRGIYDHAVRLGEFARERGVLPPGSVWLARSFIYEGRKDLALGELQAVSVDSPSDVDRLYVDTWLRRFQLEERLVELEAESACWESLVARGESRLQLADFEDAIADLTQAVELAPEKTSVRVARARAYESRGRRADYRLAIDDYDKARQLDSSFRPTYSYPHSYGFADRGEAQRMTGDMSAALREFDTALTFQPDHHGWLGRRAFVRASIAKSLDREKDAPEFVRLLLSAIDDNEKIIEINPQTTGRTQIGVGLVFETVTPGVVGLAHYNIACYRSLLSEVRSDEAARQSDLDEAVRRLRLALENGFAEAIEHINVKGLTVRQAIEQDSDLDSLRNHAGYRQLLSELE